MRSGLNESPERFADWLADELGGRAWLVRDRETGRLRTSSPALAPLAEALQASDDYADHEAVFLATGPITGALFGAFLHRVERGQAQGGVRHWPYPALGEFLRDGLRLARGMGRKCALAGLWWGGGKGLIARVPGDAWREPAHRETLYAEYGRFVSSLQGCYVTAEDAGTTPLDMAVLQQHTRFATCIPPEVGGSGNPSAMTARGVVCAMEAALDHLRAGDLRGKRIVMQGAGNVGSAMIGILIERGVEEIVVSELSEDHRQALADRFSDAPVRIEAAEPGDADILSRAGDLLVPNALGGILNEKTIPAIQAPIVCGAANNQLARGDLDARALARRGVLHVPDYVANRMGIVACSNEQAGHLRIDPAIERQLGREWPGSIYRMVREILERAEAEATTPVATADRMADEASRLSHPIWGDRTRRIIDDLARGGWTRGD